MSIFSDKIITKTTELLIDNEGILRVLIFEGAEIGLEDAKENHIAAMDLAQGKRMLKLVDARRYFTVSKEARAYVASKEVPENNIARAVITDSLANKLLVNFFIKFNKPKSPVKMFSKEKEALKWLRSFKS